MTYDVKTMSFVAGFKPKNVQLLLDKGRTLVLAFESEWKGKDWFTIREVYEEYGLWCPGKGIQIPIEHKKQFLDAIKAI